jgi:hypothetical protein
MKIFKRSFLVMILFTSTLLFSTGVSSIITEDRVNEEIFNTSDATDIVNLSATTTIGLSVCNYRIKSLPEEEAGILYMLDGTPVTVNQNLTASEAEGLTFDPKAEYIGDASFTYTGIDANGVEGSIATVTLPIVAEPTSSDEVEEIGDIVPTPLVTELPSEINNTATDLSATDTTTDTLVVITDDKINPEMLNTLPAVDILNLSGRDANGVEVNEFIINSIVIPEAGVLYMADATTAVVVNQRLTKDEADGLKFDPLETFVGDANFTYQAVDANENLGNIATVSIPLVGSNTTDINSTFTDCICEDYEESISILGNYGILLMILLTSLLGLFFTREELDYN